jgi:predicted nucleic acid-binding protein
MPIFFDTNILVYLFDNDAPNKKAAAVQLFEQKTADGQIMLSTQVLQEFYVTVTRKLAQPLPHVSARRVLEDLAQLPLVQVNAEMIVAAAERHSAAQISFWDALIVEAALSANCKTLYSEDLQTGQEIEGLRVQNPFV